MVIQFGYRIKISDHYSSIHLTRKQAMMFIFCVFIILRVTVVLLGLAWFALGLDVMDFIPPYYNRV